MDKQALETTDRIIADIQMRLRLSGAPPPWGRARIARNRAGARENQWDER